MRLACSRFPVDRDVGEKKIAPVTGRPGLCVLGSDEVGETDDRRRALPPRTGGGVEFAKDIVGCKTRNPRKKNGTIGRFNRAKLDTPVVLVDLAKTPFRITLAHTSERDDLRQVFVARSIVSVLPVVEAHRADPDQGCVLRLGQTRPSPLCFQ